MLSLMEELIDEQESKLIEHSNLKKDNKCEWEKVYVVVFTAQVKVCEWRVQPQEVADGLGPSVVDGVVAQVKVGELCVRLQCTDYSFDAFCSEAVSCNRKE